MKLKITALKDISVSAYIWFQGSIALPRGHSGAALGHMPQMQNRQEHFKLKKGESRDDVHFLVSVSEGTNPFLPRQITIPQKVGERMQDGDLLLMEGIE